jgi:hypothetical protein
LGASIPSGLRKYSQRKSLTLAAPALPAIEAATRRIVKIDSGAKFTLKNALVLLPAFVL